MVNPAYMTRLIASMAASDGGVAFSSHQPAADPPRQRRRPQGASGAGELRPDGEQEVTGIEAGPRGLMLRYMAPLEDPGKLPGLPRQAGLQAGRRARWHQRHQRCTHRGDHLRRHPPDQSGPRGHVCGGLPGGWACWRCCAGAGLAGRQDRRSSKRPTASLQSEKMASIGVLAAGVA